MDTERARDRRERESEYFFPLILSLSSVKVKQHMRIVNIALQRHLKYAYFVRFTNVNAAKQIIALTRMLCKIDNVEGSICYKI